MSMRPFNRRDWLARALALGAVPLVAAQPSQAQVVRLVAQRFHYTPSEFKVKAGQPVVLEFTALDFVHGFHIPRMKLRADLPPGTVTRLAFTPTEPGAYDFLCDNFCGDKHEEMNGRMLVEA